MSEIFLEEGGLMVLRRIDCKGVGGFFVLEAFVEMRELDELVVPALGA